MKRCRGPSEEQFSWPVVLVCRLWMNCSRLLRAIYGERYEQSDFGARPYPFRKPDVRMCVAHQMRRVVWWTLRLFDYCHFYVRPVAYADAHNV